jgi:hypothetical protein
VKLEEIDGEVLMTDSLLEKLTVKNEKIEIFIEEEKVGDVKSIKFCGNVADIEFQCSVSPLSLLEKSFRKRFSISKTNIFENFFIEEVSITFDSKRCLLKTIHRIEVKI